MKFLKGAPAWVFPLLVGLGGMFTLPREPMIREDGATVKFKQIYSSDRFTDESVKVLTFAKQDGKWHIVQEYAGS